MFFNKTNKNVEREDLIKVAALLIHAAKIDENYTDNEKEIACNTKKYSFYQQTVNYILKLQPRIFIPFAGKYTLGGKLVSLNKWRGNPEQNEMISDFLPFVL